MTVHVYDGFEAVLTPVRSRNPGIGLVVMSLVEDGETTDIILATIEARFPGNNRTTRRSVSSHRCDWQEVRCIERYAMGKIILGHLDDEVLEDVWRQFPGCKTKIGSIECYRSQVRQNYPDVPTSSQAKAGVLQRPAVH